MGQVCSYFKAKKRERADRKRRLRGQIQDAADCIVRLQEQQKCLNEILQEHYMYYPAFRPEHRDVIERRTAEVENEIETLEKKLRFGEAALHLADERDDFLDINLDLLEQNEFGLHWQCSNGQQNVAALKLKHEACQFNLYKKANPLEKWAVRSLPNLYFASM